MKIAFTLVLILITNLIHSQSRDSVILFDTYNVGFIDNNDEYHFMYKKHNTLIINTNNNTAFFSNLFNKDSKSVTSLKIVKSNHFKVDKILCYYMIFEQSPKDTLLVLIPDENKGIKFFSVTSYSIASPFSGYAMSLLPSFTT